MIKNVLTRGILYCTIKEGRLNMRVFFYGIFVFFIIFSSCENRKKNTPTITEEINNNNKPISENTISEQIVIEHNDFDVKIVTIHKDFEDKTSYGLFNTCEYGDEIYNFYKSYAIREIINRDKGWIIANGFYINPDIYYEAYYPFRFYGFEIPRYGPGGFEINYTDKREWDITSESETESERIIIYHNKLGDYSHTLHYYNIPQERLLDIFQKNLINGLLEFVNDYNSPLFDGDYAREYANEMISNLDSEGLAIFRNLLYAKNNYKFNNANWYNMFTKYYINYEGVLNNEDSLNRFTDKEKVLLEIIINREG
jgi:hypothetical protein